MSFIFPVEDSWKSAGIRTDMLAEVHIRVIVDHSSLAMRAREVNHPASVALPTPREQMVDV